MNLTGVLDTTFATQQPSTGAPLNSGAPPVSVVYRNGAVLAPAAPPIVANMAVGLYSLIYGLTAANGHAINDWVTITEAVTLDGFAVTRPAWEGNLVQAGANVTMLLGQTIYPMFTIHRPGIGVNIDPDLGAVPVVTVYRNLVATAIVPVLIHPAVGVFIVTLPLTGASGWAMGDTVDILAAATVDSIPASSWVFSGGTIVASAGGGGGVPHYEIVGHELRAQ